MFCFLNCVTGCFWLLLNNSSHFFYFVSPYSHEFTAWIFYFCAFVYDVLPCRFLYSWRDIKCSAVSSKTLYYLNLSTIPRFPFSFTTFSFILQKFGVWVKKDYSCLECWRKRIAKHNLAGNTQWTQTKVAGRCLRSAHGTPLCVPKQQNSAASRYVCPPRVSQEWNYA